MKKIISLLLCVGLGVGILTGCGSKSVSNEQNIGSVPSMNAEIASETNEVIQVMEKNSIPKYIFLFIGDGMSYPQVQLTNYYLSASTNNNTEVLTSKSI